MTNPVYYHNTTLKLWQCQTDPFVETRPGWRTKRSPKYFRLPASESRTENLRLSGRLSCVSSSNESTPHTPRSRSLWIHRHRVQKRGCSIPFKVLPLWIFPSSLIELEERRGEETGGSHTDLISFSFFIFVGAYGWQNQTNTTIFFRRHEWSVADPLNISCL